MYTHVKEFCEICFKIKVGKKKLRVNSKNKAINQSSQFIKRRAVRNTRLSTCTESRYSNYSTS